MFSQISYFVGLNPKVRRKVNIHYCWLLPYAICCGAVYPNFFIRISDTTCILLWLCLSMNNNNTFLRCSLSLLGFMSMAFYFWFIWPMRFQVTKMELINWPDRILFYTVDIFLVELLVLTEKIIFFQF